MLHCRLDWNNWVHFNNRTFVEYRMFPSKLYPHVFSIRTKGEEYAFVWRLWCKGIWNLTGICFADNRQRGRFAGFSLYVSNTGVIQDSTLCYKNGPKLPPLNFTTTCTKHGRYVIYYNERLNEVRYPEGYEVHNVFYWTVWSYCKRLILFFKKNPCFYWL